MTQDSNEPDELDLFRQATQGVKRITTNDRADVGKPRTDKKLVKTLQARATSSQQGIKVDGLSDQFVIDVHPEEELAWAANGVQESQLKKLKTGQIPFDGSIDLHGMTVERARELLWEFLAEAARMEIRCVRVTHGKAMRKDGRKPILKSHVNTWLRQHAQVLGFTSCVPRHGGTGSVYVLLKRTMLEGRDE
ncbi:DNA-nicking endonuclease, Smr domain [Halopseudomonas xinjiangensis]|uniref:DNA-nicking endonuclease, Smr domain n=1 Tax=Halopseudomonas xinjiangensis TaxID=487184 RepID=A0A1H1PPH9_9GAMM|nr:Smr/MutS family protein [Halopseudomonas xinjiangensis]SDS13212.1 DNA-nicking endonuclease, Smr domain [Halopseudomonas xinjiangensis]